MGKFYVIGIGHRAQQGKDTSADFIKEYKKNVYLLHWAQPLKDEVMNKERKYPLITRVSGEMNGTNFTIGYNILIDGEKGLYKFYRPEEVAMLDKIFDERNISIYWGMDGNGYDELKDGTMLQFWGTDFRRNMFSPTYWVDKINEQIEQIKYQWFAEEDESHGELYHEDVFVLVPDTRFENEKTCIDTHNYGRYNKSYYLRIDRYNKDGSRYFCPKRDPNHPSEIGLLNIEPDYIIENRDSLDVLKEKTIDFINKVELGEL